VELTPLLERVRGFLFDTPLLIFGKHMQVRFESSSKVARTENLIVSGIVMVSFPVVMYLFYGIRHWAILATGGLLLSAICYAAYARRYRRLGEQVICISPTTIRTEHGIKQQELSWSDIGHIDFSRREGVHWTLKPASGDAMVLWLDGFNDEQRARIGELIQQRFQAKVSQADRS
jgi:hypothetical protein